MGLIEFIKDAGEKIFKRGGDEKEAAVEVLTAQNSERAHALNDLVDNMGFEVADSTITFADGQATIRGRAASQEIREKVVLLVGNTQGVATVDDQMTVETPEPAATMYTVASGDSLSKIAKQHYGDPNKYMAIFHANEPMLKDPNKIYPGQVLRIPPVA